MSEPPAVQDAANKRPARYVADPSPSLGSARRNLRIASISAARKCPYVPLSQDNGRHPGEMPSYTVFLWWS